MRKWLGGIALLITTAVAPALAHHPFAAEYDWKKPVTITGTVTKFDWQNPHSMLSVKGKDDTGTEAESVTVAGHELAAGSSFFDQAKGAAKTSASAKTTANAPTTH